MTVDNWLNVIIIAQMTVGAWGVWATLSVFTMKQDIALNKASDDTVKKQVDALMAKAALPSSKLAMLLLELEMKNCISSLPGKRYQCIN